MTKETITEQAQRYYDALLKISREFYSADRLMKTSERLYGLSPEEALVMAYENMQNAAKIAIKGRRRPKGAENGKT